MATIAVQVVTEEIEKISTEKVVCETRSETVTEALVALPSNNTTSNTTDADSGILTCANSDDEKSSQPVEESLTGKALTDEHENKLSQESNVKLSLDSRCSQESRASSCSTKSSCSSMSKKSESASSRYTNENSNSSYSSTVKGSQKVNNEDEDSRSSISSSASTIKTSQHTTCKSDDESNSRSSFVSSNKKSSPEKQSDNESNFKRSQSVHVEDDDSSSTIAGSNSRSTTKISQSILADKSDEEGNTISSFQSASKNSSPEKASDSKKSTPEKESDSIKSQSKKYFNIIDSDSEDEIIAPQRYKDDREQSGSDSDASKSLKPSKSRKKQKIKNKRKLVDSDSDEESVKNDKSSNKKQTETSDKEDESEKEESKSVNKSNKISNIIDSDSESGNDNRSENRSNASSSEENDAGQKKKEKKKSEKKRSGSARASKDTAMQQIHSETQRLMREAEISLPYHRPKQRTLQEFLNRKKITSDIPKNLTFAEKVKMFPEVISKVVQEKEEQAEIFYKSSDSEEEQDEPMEVDETATTNKDNENKNENEISTANGIADTQKLTQDHIQDSHDKMTILHQRCLDFGVPRKLFLEDIDDNSKTENTPVPEERANTDESINTDITALEKKPREVKSGIREASVPRKLFTGQEMDMDVDTNEDDVDLSKEKDEESPKMSENIEIIDKTVEKTNKTTLENSNEEIVLNFSETEHDINDAKKSSESSRHSYSEQNKGEESIVISETPFISNKEIAKTNRAASLPPNDQIITENKENESSNKKEQNDTDDLIFKLASESKDDDDDDEIIDPDILRANFALPLDLDEPVVKKPSMKETILANAMKNKPMIKASPGSTIDFTNNSGQMKEGVTQLLDRFARHSTIHRPKVNQIAEVKTIRTEGTGNDVTIVEEILPFSKTIMEDDPKKDRKPGEKLQKLREDLKRKIASVRNEEWKLREEKDKEEEEEEAKCKGEDFYEGLPDEEEELEDEVSTESEPEEDDVPMKESRKPKCAFGDEEAEESEDENAAVFGGNENEEDEEENEEAEDEEEEEEEQDSEKEEINDKPKKLKRIIRPFDEDSNESKSSVSNDAKPKLFPGSNRVRNKTDEDMFASQASNGSEDLEADSIPLFQSRDRCGSDSRSQACKTPLPKPNNLLSMVSPVTQLTALNTSRDSTKKSASKTPNALNLGPIGASVENTPTENSANRPQTSCNMEKMIGLQKKLFEDPPDSVNDDELLEICSGRFTNTQSSERPPNVMSQNGVTDSQLMELCSGAFVSQPVDIKKLESDNVGPSRPEFGDETSQDITLTLDDDDDSKSSPAKTVSSLKRSDDSMFSSDSKSPVKLPTFGGTSFKNPMEAWLKRGNDKPTAETQQKPDQVTDSQLMDLCSGAFTSQAVNLKALEEYDSPQIHDDASQDFNLTLDDNTKSPFKKALQSQKPKLNEQPKQTVTALNDDSNAPRTTFTIVSSSDEDDGEAKKGRPKKKLLKKKKVKQLTLSDDEDEDEAAKEFSDEEESEIEDEEEDDEEKFVDYDSEENEVVVVAKKEIKKVAKKFLENEAELSESDWDSADEDEQGMDKLEFEEADAEEIDEDKMKEQLDRVHMKQVMDEDQREVRMLQELLFDDGDLHSEGAGRERKFKWKNIDNLDDLTLTPRTDDNGEAVDDEIDTEMEVQMRKMRYEQQKFLEEKEKSLDIGIDEDFSENKLFNRGLKIVTVRSTSKTSIEEQKLVKSNSVGNSTNILIAKGTTSVTKKAFTSTKSLSFSNMKGSFLSRGDETLIRIAQNLPEKGKMPTNAGRKGNFVFQHLSPSVSNAPKDDSEQENDNTPAHEKNKRKRKMFASQSSGQTPRSTKKLKVDDRTAGKKLF